MLVSGHGGNLPAIVAAVRQLRYEGHEVGWTACAPPPEGDGAPTDSHAGRIETSLALALAPDQVRLDLAAPGALEPLSALLSRMRVGGVSSVSPNGVLGDPSGASAQEGVRLLWSMVADVVSSMLTWAPDDQGRLRSERRRVVA